MKKPARIREMIAPQRRRLEGAELEAERKYEAERRRRAATAELPHDTPETERIRSEHGAHRHLRPENARTYAERNPVPLKVHEHVGPDDLRSESMQRKLYPNGWEK
jgi:hypothetical protein